MIIRAEIAKFCTEWKSIRYPATYFWADSFFSAENFCFYHIRPQYEAVKTDQSEKKKEQIIRNPIFFSSSARVWSFQFLFEQNKTKIIQFRFY